MTQFLVGILIIGLAAALGWFGAHLAQEGWKKIKHPESTITNIEKQTDDIFKATVVNLMRFKYPGPLLFFYNSQFGKTISPISIAMYIEVANNKQVISRIHSFKTRALMLYDEGGITEVSEIRTGDYSFKYLPSGNIVEKWRTLYSVGFLHDQIYFVPNNDWTKSKRIDFSKNSFELLAREKQLIPGQSLMGWIFFEIEQDLRVQIPEIEKIEFTLKNSAGEAQIMNLDVPKADDASSVISSGAWNILGGYYDLTSENYTLCPSIDVKTILKEGKSISIPARKKR